MADDFDPDAFLRERGFDPDTFLQQRLRQAETPAQQFDYGAAQGLFNYGEEPLRMIREAGGPNLLPARAERFRQQVESSEAGRTGEMVGGIAVPVATSLLTGGAAAVPQIAARTPSFLSRAAEIWGARSPGTRAAITGALQPTDADVHGSDYWRQKAEQAGAAGLTGKFFGGFATRADQAAKTAAAQARQAPDVRNIEFYKWVMEPTGQPAPVLAGGASLAKMQRDIGDQLNAANRQLNFTDSQAWRNGVQATSNAVGQGMNTGAAQSEWTDVVSRNVLAPLSRAAQGQGPGTLSGDQYAKYISGLKRAAEDMAAKGRRTGDRDYFDMASGLRGIANAVQNSAQGPPEAMAAARAGNEAYRRWSIISGAADPSKGDIPDAAAIIREWTGRQGEARYRADRDPMKDKLETWRQEQSARPEKPEPRQGPRAAAELGKFAAHAAGGFPLYWALRHPLDYMAAQTQAGWMARFLARQGKDPAFLGAAAGQAAPQADPLIEPLVPK